MEAIEAQVITLEQAISNVYSTIKEGNDDSLEEDIFKIKSIIGYKLTIQTGVDGGLKLPCHYPRVE